MTQADAKKHVTRACQLRGFDLIKPTRKAPGVLVYDWSTGYGNCIVDADSWQDASEQLSAWARAQYH